MTRTRAIAAVVVGALVVVVPASARPRVTLLAHRAAVKAQTTTLVSPDGAPIGGRLQRWVNGMRVPTELGSLVVSTDMSVCPRFDGCATNLAWGGPVTAIYLRLNVTPFMVFHEIGHEFDARYLTSADRATLTRWLSRDVGLRPSHWLDTQGAGQDGNGMMEYFANAYATCAQGDRVNEDPRVCRYVVGIGTKRTGYLN